MNDLIERGADVNVQDQNATTPLYMAINGVSAIQLYVFGHFGPTIVSVTVSGIQYNLAKILIDNGAPITSDTIEELFVCVSADISKIEVTYMFKRV